MVVPAMNPSYLALDPPLKHLYSVNEMTDGHVSAYGLDQANGKLSFLNSMSANGKDTTHLSVQLSGQYLFAANYTSGNFPVYRKVTHGEGRRALAQKFGVSADALWRHSKNHISEEYRRAVKIGPFESEESLRKLLAETGASVLDRLGWGCHRRAHRWDSSPKIRFAPDSRWRETDSNFRFRAKGATDLSFRFCLCP